MQQLVVVFYATCCVALTVPNLFAATKSMEKLAFIAPFLSKKMLEVTWHRLLEKPEDQRSSFLSGMNPMISSRSSLADLNHAPNMTSLPPAYIVVAEFDPLQDEGAYYASRLSDHAVPVSSPSARIV